MNTNGFYKKALIVNSISLESRKVLSTPINLLIFSETYRYQGDVEINEIWEGNVIDGYFIRKKEDIYKRYIHGFTSNIFFQLISVLAFSVVKAKKNSITRTEIKLIIKENFFILALYDDEIIDALISELIIVRDSENFEILRFRHSRFLEFLLAFYIVYSIKQEQNLEKLNYFTQVSFESGIVLMFRVHEDIRYIGKTKFPQILVKIEDYYSQSNFFMSKKLMRLRSDLSLNLKTDTKDLSLILKNTNSNDPKLITEAYFVIVAKLNNQPKATVLNLFNASFKNHHNLKERYKLIPKLVHHDLLVNESVLNCLQLSNIAKEWEVYLGLILSNNLQKEFQELWQQFNSSSKLSEIININTTEDWRQVSKLFEAIVENKQFALGDSLT